MGAAIGLIYVCVFFFIIVKVLKVANKKGAGKMFGDPSHQSPAYKAAMDAIQKGAVANSDAAPIASAVHVNMQSKEPAVNRLMDDREHDWLAMQLRDERAAKKKMSEMFDLKREHATNCDAEMLKRFHADNCDAEGIDTARA